MNLMMKYLSRYFPTLKGSDDHTCSECGKATKLEDLGYVSDLPEYGLMCEECAECIGT